METFTGLKPFVDNPHYDEQRRACSDKLELDIAAIDAPIIEIVRGFARLPYCFTLQSCYGHFLYAGQKNPNNTQPMPKTDGITDVEYRIGYVALCIEDSLPGRELFDALGSLTAIDPEYVQFGCAVWFWKRQVNSYALQVEPERYMTKDRATVSYQEALHIEGIRNQFFDELNTIIQGKTEEA